MRRFTLLIACLFLIGHAHAQHTPLVRMLDSIVNSRFRNSEPGGSIQIRKEGRIIYARSFGVADLKSGRKFNNRTLANVGSITKTFVAYTILDLANKKRLSLNDKLVDYFPSFKNQELASKVTIWSLLSHTSGLPDLRQTESDSVYYLTARDAENFAPLYDADSLNFEPGANFEYSNPAYNGLALIIEKVTGRKWQEVVTETIFKPAGMKQSLITDGAFPSEGVSHGYRYYRDGWDEYDYGEYPTFAAAGNGGAWCSVTELSNYVDALRGYKILNKEIIDSSFTAPLTKAWKQRKPPVHGCCWFAYQPNLQGQYELVEHAGFQGGFRSHVLMYRAEQLDVIWIANNDADLTALVLPVLLNLQYIPFTIDFH